MAELASAEQQAGPLGPESRHSRIKLSRELMMRLARALDQARQVSSGQEEMAGPGKSALGSASPARPWRQSAAECTKLRDSAAVAFYGQQGTTAATMDRDSAHHSDATATTKTKPPLAECAPPANPSETFRDLAKLAKIGPSRLVASSARPDCCERARKWPRRPLAPVELAQQAHHSDIRWSSSMSTTSKSPFTCSAQCDAPTISNKTSCRGLEVAQTVAPLAGSRATTVAGLASAPASGAAGRRARQWPGCSDLLPLNINDGDRERDDDDDGNNFNNLNQSHSNNLNAIRQTKLVGRNDCSSKLDEESWKAPACKQRRTNSFHLSSSSKPGSVGKLSYNHGGQDDGDDNDNNKAESNRTQLNGKLKLAATNRKTRGYKLLKVARNEPTVILPSWARPGRSAALLALLLATFGLLLALSRAHPQVGGADEELSRAVLDTMSTQAPPVEQLNGSSSGGGGGGEPSAPSHLLDELKPQAESALDRLLEQVLDFCRIFIMSSIIVGDICGNSLVILSVCRHSKLRVTTNWFVVSLACADILVALFAMTFNASVIIWGRWLFQRWVCDFWNSCDVLASTASILHLCCISIDRYIAITRPLDYPMKITTRRVMYALCAVWVSSALLSYIPIFTGIYTTEEHQLWLKSNPDQCEFTVNRVYAVVSSSVSFWIPCCIMVFTYYRIYREASRQEKFIYKAQSMMPQPIPNHHHQQHHGNNQHQQRPKQRRSKSVAAVAGLKALTGPANKQRPSKGAAVGLMATTKLDSAGPGCKAAVAGQSASSLSRLEQEAAAGPERQPLTCAEIAPGLGQIQQPASVSFSSQAPPAENLDLEELDEPDSNSGQSTPTKRSISKMKREHKAAKTLGIIMGVFILCWFPFFTWYTSQHICGRKCDGMVPKRAVTILFWIGYFNSTLNPIIYAYFNHEFRDAFKKTLQWIFCCCSDLKCLRVSRPNDNQHYNCTYRSTQEIGLVSNG